MIVWTILEFIDMRTVVLHEKREWFGEGISTCDAIIQLVLTTAFFLDVVMTTLFLAW